MHFVINEERIWPTAAWHVFVVSATCLAEYESELRLVDVDPLASAYSHCFCLTESVF